MRATKMNKEYVSDKITEKDGIADESVTPKDMLKFAKAILLMLAILFTIGVICEMIKTQSTVFEACRTILPPIATLVIGYYFGKS